MLKFLESIVTFIYGFYLDLFFKHPIITIIITPFLMYLPYIVVKTVVFIIKILYYTLNPANIREKEE